MEPVKCYPEENRDEEKTPRSSPSEPSPLIIQNIDNPLVENVYL